MKTAWFWIRIWIFSWIIYASAIYAMTAAGLSHRAAIAWCWVMFIAEILKNWALSPEDK